MSQQTNSRIPWIIGTITVGLLLLIGGATVFALMASRISELEARERSFVFPLPVFLTPTPSQPSLKEKLSSLNKLVTYHYSIEKVVSGESTAFQASDKILLVGHGDVIAGVDLSKLKPQDIVTSTIATDSVTIKLPQAEVFNRDNILDNSKTYVYDRNRPNPLYTDASLETRVREAAAEQILQAAIEDGVLSKAQTNAEEVVKRIVTGLGYKEVKFETGP